MKKYFELLAILFVILFSSCNSNNRSNDSIDQNQFFNNESGNYVDNSTDSLLIADYINCGAINSENLDGFFQHDNNGKIFYQNGSLCYTTDGRYVYESNDGGEPQMIECGEVETSEIGNNQNLESNENTEYQSNHDDYNSWQCRYCAIISRSLKEPCCGQFGDCPVDYSGNHSFSMANTNHGRQCARCGIQSFIVQDREPCCGEFGDCPGTSMGHSWQNF